MGVMRAGRDWVVALTAPGVAAGDSAEAEPTAADKAVAFDGLKKILGAGGMKTAAGAGTSDKVDGGGEEALIEADAQPNDRFHAASCGGGMGGGEDDGRSRIPARLARWSQSFSSSASESWGAFQRAMTTQCQPGAISARC